MDAAQQARIARLLARTTMHLDHADRANTTTETRAAARFTDNDICAVAYAALALTEKKNAENNKN